MKNKDGYTILDELVNCIWIYSTDFIKNDYIDDDDIDFDDIEFDAMYSLLNIIIKLYELHLKLNIQLVPTYKYIIINKLCIKFKLDMYDKFNNIEKIYQEENRKGVIRDDERMLLFKLMEKINKISKINKLSRYNELCDYKKVTIEPTI